MSTINKTIGAYITQEHLFNSELFASSTLSGVVAQIRDLIDPPGADPGSYAMNGVDQYILHEFGDWEMRDGLFMRNSSGVIVGYNGTAIQDAIDNALAANAYAWISLARTYELDFNPLYNVDANESTITSYGEHKTDKKRAAHDDTVQHGQHTDTNTNSQTTMDDTSTFVPKSKQEQSNPEYSDVYKYPEATDTDTSNAHTDRVTIRKYGNIGVTKSTELLSDYWDFVQRSVTPVIARTLARELCITLWW